MPSKKIKINFSKYVLFSSFSTIGICVYFGSLEGILVTIGIAIASMINQILLCKACNLLLYPEGKLEKNKIAFLFIFKMTLLFAAFFIGVQFIQDRIIIPVVNYVIQIFALYFSLRK